MTPIYIPTSGRAEQIFTGNRTLAYLKAVQNTIYVVVSENQKSKYIDHLQSSWVCTPSNVSIVVHDKIGIAATRQFIGHHAHRVGYSKFIMLDDDLRFSVRKDVSSNKLRPQVATDTINMINFLVDALDTHSHAGISARTDAVAGYVRNGGLPPLAFLNKRMTGAVGYRTKSYLDVNHGRVEFMEDHDVTLQLIKLGYWNIVAHWWAYDQSATNTAGGCSVMRTLDKHNASAQKLHALHADVTRLRVKNNISKVSSAEARALQNRMEVTIYWERAAKNAGWIKGTAAI
jgi:hypothetical protein